MCLTLLPFSLCTIPLNLCSPFLILPFPCILVPSLLYPGTFSPFPFLHFPDILSPLSYLISFDIILFPFSSLLSPGIFSSIPVSSISLLMRSIFDPLPLYHMIATSLPLSLYHPLASILLSLSPQVSLLPTSAPCPPPFSLASSLPFPHGYPLTSPFSSHCSLASPLPLPFLLVSPGITFLAPFVYLPSQMHPRSRSL